MKHVPVGRLATQSFNELLDKSPEAKLTLAGFVDAHPDINLQPGEQLKLVGQYTLTIIPAVLEDIQVNGEEAPALQVVE